MMNKRYKLGFTGTRDITKLNDNHFENFKEYIRLNKENIIEFHHGCCMGADEWAHKIVREAGIPIVLHPPVCKDIVMEGLDDLMFEQGILFRADEEYIQRDKNIVDAVDELYGMSKSMNELQRSGTWATIRYAKKTQTPVVIVYPDGSVAVYEDYR